MGPETALQMFIGNPFWERHLCELILPRRDGIAQFWGVAGSFSRKHPQHQTRFDRLALCGVYDVLLLNLLGEKASVIIQESEKLLGYLGLDCLL
jgi:hypothetical protein